MTSKILNPTWFYDKLVNLDSQEVKRIESEERDLKKKKDDLMKKAGNPQFHPLGSQVLDLFRSVKSEYEREYMAQVETLSMEKKSVLENLRLWREMHPFILGSATLDSLINERPKSYEYLKNFNLPFDSLWFEFSEPFEMNLPFHNKSNYARGIEFRRTPNAVKTSYNAKVYFSVSAQNLERDLISLSIDFNPELQGVFMGGLVNRNNRLHKDALLGFMRIFLLESDKNLVHFADGKKIYESGMFSSGEFVGLLGHGITQSEEFRNAVLSRKFSINEIINNEVLYQIPNLCTNLINYINAHNVTVIRKERDVIEIDAGKGTKNYKRPFHLLVVKDEIMEEPEEPKESGLWTLQHRVYVRGHDRKYRDNDGNIRMTSWIPPHIRGPANAPFKEVRYQVLFDKLKREQEMNRKFGLIN